MAIFYIDLTTKGIPARNHATCVLRVIHRQRSPGGHGASDLELGKKSERHFRSVCVALFVRFRR